MPSVPDPIEQNHMRRTWRDNTLGLRETLCRGQGREPSKQRGHNKYLRSGCHGGAQVLSAVILVGAGLRAPHTSRHERMNGCRRRLGARLRGVCAPHGTRGLRDAAGLLSYANWDCLR
jgi:hypothetical protein